jgi:hypothetical protein
MKLGRRLAAVGAGAVLALGVSIAVTGTAHASIGPTIYTSTAANGGNSVAGWSAFQTGTFTLTHIEAYQGSSGHSEWENLPVDANLASAHVGNTLVSSQQPKGGLGMALCDRNTGGLGEAAQLGIINVGGGLFDEVEGLGVFHQPALNSSGDVCDNGILGDPSNHSAALVLKVLLTGIHANDTVQAGIAYNAKQNYTFGGHVVAKGDVTFYATDLSNPTDTNEDFLGGGAILPQPLVTNEADVGVVSDTTASVPLSGVSVPAPNGGSLESLAPNEFARFAHVKLSANSTIIGHHMISGAGAFEGSGVPWNVYPVASTSDGTAGGILKMDPQQFAADNFAVEGGITLI